MVNNHWLLVWNMNFMDDFSIYWECHHPNWRTPIIFQRGRVLNHQPAICFFLHFGVSSIFCVNSPNLGHDFSTVMAIPGIVQVVLLRLGRTGQRQPWNPVVKWRCYFWKWMLRHGTMQHFLCQFGTAISTSFFKSLRFRWNFFGRVLFPFHATWTWKVGNCKQCPFHVHYVSIFLWSKLCCLVHIFSTFFQLFSSRFGMMIS